MRRQVVPFSKIQIPNDYIFFRWIYVVISNCNIVICKFNLVSQIMILYIYIVFKTTFILPLSVSSSAISFPLWFVMQLPIFMDGGDFARRRWGNKDNSGRSWSDLFDPPPPSGEVSLVWSTPDRSSQITNKYCIQHFCTISKNQSVLSKIYFYHNQVFLRMSSSKFSWSYFA